MYMKVKYVKSKETQNDRSNSVRILVIERNNKWALG